MPLEIKIDMKVANYGDIIKLAVEETAHTIRERSRADTAAAGFTHWAPKLTVPVKRITGGYLIQVKQKPGFLKVYEQGGTSRGKPLLWIPVAGRNIRLSKYKGPKLFRPRGRNVLLDPQRKVRFVGIASHTHRKRLHLRAIAKEETDKFLARMMPLIRSKGSR
jgi:hypothetical protein